MGIALALLTALSFALFDVTRRELSAFVSPFVMLTLFCAGSGLLVMPIAGLNGQLLPPGDYWLIAILAIAIQASANICFINSLMLAPFSTVIPILSLTPAIAALLAMLILKEYPTTLGWIGIFTVVAGALWLALHAKKRSGSEDHGDTHMQGIALMILVALLWSVAPIVDKICLVSAKPLTHTYIQFLGQAVIFATLLTVKGKLQTMRDLTSAPRLAAGGVVISATAFVVQNMALVYVLAAALESTKRGLGMVMALVFGKVLYKENVSPGKVVCVVFMLIGVQLILVFGK